MKALLLGGEGQLGKCFGLNISKKFKIFAKSKKDINVIDLNEIKKAVELYEPDYIINCSAYTDVDKAELEKEQADVVNFQGPKNIIEAIKNTNVRLIHISTDYVFNGLKKIKYNEYDQPDPICYYGLSKLKGEKYIQDYSKNFLIFRVSWLYSQFNNNYLKTMIKLGNKFDNLSIVSDQISIPNNANELASFIIELIYKNKINEENLNDIYHFSPLINPISKFEFSEKIFSILNKQGIKTPVLEKVDSNSFNSNAKRPSFSALDGQLLSKRFNYKYSNWIISLDHTIKNIINDL